MLTNKKSTCITEVDNLVSYWFYWQERRDSNPQPPVLETGALTKLSYTPKRMRF